MYEKLRSGGGLASWCGLSSAGVWCAWVCGRGGGAWERVGGGVFISVGGLGVCIISFDSCISASESLRASACVSVVLAFLCACMYVSLYLSMYMRMYVCMYMYAYIHIRACMHVYIYVYHACICIYACMSVVLSCASSCTLNVSRVKGGHERPKIIWARALGVRGRREDACRLLREERQRRRRRHQRDVFVPGGRRGAVAGAGRGPALKRDLTQQPRVSLRRLSFSVLLFYYTLPLCSWK